MRNGPVGKLTPPKRVSLPLRSSKRLYLPGLNEGTEDQPLSECPKVKPNLHRAHVARVYFFALSGKLD
ncbi:MAG: hypothetical protein ABJA32_08135 [Ginsengibacter sp.]